MADNGSRPKPEEIILYGKDPKTKIATITFNRPEYLNAPTSAARLRYADLLRAATVDNDVKVVAIRGVGDNLGSGADLPEFMEGDWRTKASARSAIRPRGRSATARQSARGMPTCRPVTDRCPLSMASYMSRSSVSSLTTPLPIDSKKADNRLPFTADEMYQCNFLNKVVPRDQLEAEVDKYARACARNRPVDTVFQLPADFRLSKSNRKKKD
jgi:enoyl-CoA hydratase/carnithine racemase